MGGYMMNLARLFACAAVAGATYAVLALPLFVGFTPIITQFLPNSILGWIVGFASGADVGFITPIAYAVALIAIAAVGFRRLERMEL